MCTCCRPIVPVRLSSGERRTETIMLSAGSSRPAAHIVQRRFCALPSIWRTAAAVTTVFLRHRSVVSLVGSCQVNRRRGHGTAITFRYVYVLVVVVSLIVDIAGNLDEIISLL